jgi:hypothetical protein
LRKPQAFEIFDLASEDRDGDPRREPDRNGMRNMPDKRPELGNSNQGQKKSGHHDDEKLTPNFVTVAATRAMKAPGKGILAIFTEYDRNIIWAFAENGTYALSSPLLGTPVLGKAPKTWPAPG